MKMVDEYSVARWGADYIEIYTDDVGRYQRVSFPRGLDVELWDAATFKIKPPGGAVPWLLTLSPSGLEDINKTIILKGDDGRIFLLTSYSGTIAAGYVDDLNSVAEVEISLCRMIAYAHEVEAIVCVGVSRFACIRPGLAPVYVRHGAFDFQSARIVNDRILEINSDNQIDGGEILVFDLSEF
ncbi:hypothetical protein [Pseudaminobacter soli (ex Li et al. 2025)]|uniref:hypothetical protein n=1 Tax=Pseudaminobacter soli (ex Li et al. 2025) TaxID=1295366 RepID=UPI000D10E6A3|nr:hypothetical protein [Mesorhizobium soli]